MLHSHPGYHNYLNKQSIFIRRTYCYLLKKSTIELCLFSGAAAVRSFTAKRIASTKCALSTSLFLRPFPFSTTFSSHCTVLHNVSYPPACTSLPHLQLPAPSVPLPLPARVLYALRIRELEAQREVHDITSVGIPVPLIIPEQLWIQLSNESNRYGVTCGFISGAPLYRNARPCIPIPFSQAKSIVMKPDSCLHIRIPHTYTISIPVPPIPSNCSHHPSRREG